MTFPCGILTASLSEPRSFSPPQQYMFHKHHAFGVRLRTADIQLTVPPHSIRISLACSSVPALLPFCGRSAMWIQERLGGDKQHSELGLQVQLSSKRQQSVRHLPHTSLSSKYGHWKSD